jgi:hypothetical protein
VKISEKKKTVRDILRHCKTEVHISNCGWTIERIFAGERIFKTCPVVGPLDDYIKKCRSTNAQTSTGSEEQAISVLNSETVEQVEMPEQVEMELMSEEAR